MKKSIKITFLLLMFVMIISCGTIVNASETNVETEEILNLFPTEMTIDLNESEYLKANDIIENNINKILKDNNINKDKVSYSELYIYGGREEFLKLTIKVNSTEKVINIKFKNTSEYNSKDEQIVKQMSIPNAPSYIAKDFDNVVNEEFDLYTYLMTKIENYYQEKLEDKSIEIKAVSPAGSGDLFSFEFHGLFLGIFKNGILYDTKRIEIPVITKMTIPCDTTLTDEEYALSQIKKYYTVEGINLREGAKINNVEIPNGYTVFEDGIIILEREKATVVEEKEEKTGITLESATNIVPENTKLIVETIDNTKIEGLDEKVNNFVAYEITLTSDNVKIQPNGKVKINIPIPNNFDTSNLVVYRLEGTKQIKYDVTVTTIDNKKFATFETDHFSTYVLAENNVTKQEENTTSSSDNKLDETPKTGTTLVTESILFISLISLVEIVILKKNKR